MSTSGAAPASGGLQGQPQSQIPIFPPAGSTDVGGAKKEGSMAADRTADEASPEDLAVGTSGPPTTEEARTGTKRKEYLGNITQASGDAVTRGRTGAATSASAMQNPGQPKPKRRGGLFALLCCSSSDRQDEEEHELAQAPKPAIKPLPQRGQQTVPSRQQQEASLPNTSTTESKEGVNEQMAPNQYAPVEPKVQSSEEKAVVSMAPTEKPVPELPREEMHNNPESRPLYDSKQPSRPLDTGTGGTLSDSTTAIQGTGPVSNFARQVPTTTPVVPQSREEEAIADQTPHQRAQDEDIEMHDASGPSVPLTTGEAAAVAGVGAGVVGAGLLASQQNDNRELNQQIPTTLPPPPPVTSSQAEQKQPESETAYDGTVVSQPGAGPMEEKKWLLPPIRPELKGRKCLVLDLDETLVHSSFKILHQADFTLPVEIEGQYHNVYVIKRPGVDTFLKRVGELYEIVVFTASVSKYGDPLLDQLDIHHVVHHRLFRESCFNHQGNYVKDLSMMGRDLRETIIIDNSPTSYIFHPMHAVPISSWFSDAHDNELLDLIPVLEDLAGPQVSDVSLVLDVAL